jgi:hypothetical protein
VKRRLLFALVLAGVTVALYRKATRLWWMFDDPSNLHFALTHTFQDALRMPEPAAAVVPKLLLLTAGVDAEPWYRVQIGLVLFATVALFFTLRLFVGTVPALGGAGTFLAGVPIVTLVLQLRTMPVVLSLLFATAAVACYAVAFRRRSFALEALSALLYLLAGAFHILALLLPVLLFFVPAAPQRVRVRHLLLHGLAYVVLLTWRASSIVLEKDVTAILPRLAGEGLFFGLIALAVLLGGIAKAFRIPGSATALLATLTAAVATYFIGGTIIPLWLWLCVALTFGAAAMELSPRFAILIIAAGAVTVANRQEWTAQYAQAWRMSSEARAFMSLDGASLLRRPAIPPTAMPELRWLKEQHFQRAIGTGWFYDDFYLCGHLVRGLRYYEFSDATRQVAEVTARMPDFAGAYCGKLRDDVPLWAEFHHRTSAISWRLGPRQDGRYALLVDDGIEAFDAPREGRRPLADLTGNSLRIRYDSPEGWTTYSPEIALDFTRQPDFTWHR